MRPRPAHFYFIFILWFPVVVCSVGRRICMHLPWIERRLNSRRRCSSRMPSETARRVDETWTERGDVCIVRSMCVCICVCGSESLFLAWLCFQREVEREEGGGPGIGGACPTRGCVCVCWWILWAGRGWLRDEGACPSRASSFRSVKAGRYE
ncbi:uncharacterized protein LY79DRAFT_566130 [Colletotrichum navitas]|uniref:Uncharacterized protein n=1 Tax=Colletotrichum navitas TaxID=681940 RepID=A0AAD8V1K0_9PEZI|nr:uncharacterized protein LY79DRAFT_566130 [Colletotrichum navitas]KAK1574394.1 hypothetical protein LY79DRAFT_566130 [Colletotrichum navitas]